jgi:ubiquinone/menaquinone biosynthesis C-methylase UbiE
MYSKEIVKEQYSNSANLDIRQEFHKYNINKKNWHEWCFEHMEIPEGAVILELGCGNGLMWEINAREIKDDWTVVLSDFSEGMLASARERLGEISSKFSYKVLDIQDIPFPDNSFDVIIASHMLYHVPDLDKAMEEVKRVLKPGGRFYSTTNGDNSLVELQQLTIQKIPRDTFVPQKYLDIFGFVSGEKLITRYFSNIKLEKFEGKIVISEAAPIVNYIKSSIRGSQYFTTQERVEEFYSFVEGEIKKKGSLSFTTSAGMFTAIK